MHEQIDGPKTLRGHGTGERLCMLNGTEDSILHGKHQTLLLLGVGADAHGRKKLPHYDILASIDIAGEHPATPPAERPAIVNDYDPKEFPMAMSPGDPGWNDIVGTAPGPRVNATFVTLARNSDVWDIARSIRQVEDRFNRRYNYDWVFLNDKPFDETFKKVTTSLVSGKTHYGEIPKEHWSFPEWIDQDKAKKVREDMAQRKIIYGDSVSYRHMCRFESGFFFRQPLMMNYEYYWRVEPSIELFCDIHYDPFRVMKENNRKRTAVKSVRYHIEDGKDAANNSSDISRRSSDAITEWKPTEDG
ncbi:hypothetical protein BN1708_013871, partial [Verticillium longisporum]